MIENQLLSTGAFEITLNGEFLFHKVTCEGIKLAGGKTFVFWVLNEVKGSAYFRFKLKHPKKTNVSRYFPFLYIRQSRFDSFVCYVR